MIVSRGAGWWQRVGIDKKEALQWEALALRYAAAGLWVEPQQLWAILSKEALERTKAIEAFMREHMAREE